MEAIVTAIGVMVVFGAIVGALGRLALPGPDPMGFLGTVGVGIAGSLVAGFIARLLFGPQAIPGLMGSVLGATGVVWLVRRSRTASR